MNTIYYGGLLAIGRLLAIAIVGRLTSWQRYDRDTYLEVDISSVPPGEVIQIIWNGEPVFIRRLTNEEVKDEEEVPKSKLLEPNASVSLR